MIQDTSVEIRGRVHHVVATTVPSRLDDLTLSFGRSKQGVLTCGQSHQDTRLWQNEKRATTTAVNELLPFIPNTQIEHNTRAQRSIVELVIAATGVDSVMTPF
jgi:hypothetical protein